MLINAHIGLTIHIGPALSNQYARLDLEYKDIDLSLPLEAQMAEAEKTATALFQKLLLEMNKQVGLIRGSGIK